MVSIIGLHGEEKLGGGGGGSGVKATAHKYDCCVLCCFSKHHVAIVTERVFGSVRRV